LIDGKSRGIQFTVGVLKRQSNEASPKKSQKLDSTAFAETETRLDATPNTYEFGEFVLDVDRGSLLKTGVEVRLRPKVYEALKYLVENPDRLIGKQELMQAVWPDAFVTDDSLVQCIIELRRALDDRNQQLVKTVPRRGYLFTAAIVHRSKQHETSASTAYFDAAVDGAAPRPRVAVKRHDLPTPRTSLVGREREVSDASDLLLRGDVRLLSLTGPGGAGKTRLGIAVAEAVADRFSGGVVFVNLASIMQADQVGISLVDALEIQQVANRTIPQLVGDSLKGVGPFLLLLDNFEQVLPAAGVVSDLLRTCPSLKVLVTSRSCLRVYGEQEFPVTPLAQGSAVELFAHRAAAVWPDFAITPENETAVGEICTRLDGLPLAIELAAARTRMLPPSAILDRLDHPLQLLTGGALDLPERQQTLRKAIDWSHGLLNEDEQRLFRRLSVFVGGCSLESAEAVCNTRADLETDLFDGLSSLVDKNLVQCLDRTQAEPRFAMLETIREYAMEKLKESGEQFATRRAHSAYCLVLAEEGNPELNSSERTAWLTRCDHEIENLRSALDWLFETVNADWSLRLCVALFRFWDMREHLSEGRARLETVRTMAGLDFPKERARVSLFLGALATAQGDYKAAEGFLKEGLSLYEELDDEPGIAASLNALAISTRDGGDLVAAQTNFERSLACWRLLSDRSAVARCLHNLANVVRARGDYPRARWALGEAKEIFQELGDRSGAAWSTNQLGDIAHATGDIAGARLLYERALTIFRDAGDPWGSARSLADLGSIHCEQGSYSSANAAFREALKVFAALEHRRGVARVLEGYACLAVAEEQAERALTLAAAATELRRLISAPLSQAEQSPLDKTLQRARKALTESEARNACNRGSTMSLEDAIRCSFGEPESVISDLQGQ
jgi:predicted ATPase/DNA-binding winged helix-turn-helix (wHTH) protein